MPKYSREKDVIYLKSTFSLYYKTLHRVVKSLSKALPRSNTLTDDEVWMLKNLGESNEYLYEMRKHLRWISNRFDSFYGRIDHLTGELDKTRRDLRYWRRLKNEEVLEYPRWIEECP